MGFLTETEIWEPGVYKLTRDDFVDAGVDGEGPDNLQAQQLANRVKYLRARKNADDVNIAIAASPYVVSADEFLNGTLRITSAILGAVLRVPEPALGAARKRTIINDSANDVEITTALGTSTATLKAGASKMFEFLRVDALTTRVFVPQADAPFDSSMALAFTARFVTR